ncbi:proline iminopeptidase-family hydrolase [Aureisphaera sp. CAU 1614]|uniref:Proline iminopeptidase-family hydrolase n=1 Tax=Halomarinibacterium sedimenti TaxID=2857106 RepID=A0A9X1JXI4_9FLAO|nr:proline iminopeptidase-family hydrolase [Halomarinibacterium sedimenti]MBW2938163.1 proline iminopeptidase-family hydrolase [Halomarinibacterium sedimenti]
MKKVFAILFTVFIGISCENHAEKSSEKKCPENTYWSFEGRDDQATGGIKMIPIETPKGTFNVWTKRIGNNPAIKVLLLHGGPGMTHEIYESFDGFFPQEGIEYYYYDQLGSYYSDQPEDLSLWDTARFVEEVEQVRKALDLTNDNFYLFGQSWGGILALEYALKYQDNLKGLIISNMVPSIPDYMKYNEEVLAPQLPKEVLDKIMQYEAAEDYGNQEYLDLIVQHYYPKHVIRLPPEKWPNSLNRGFSHLNPDVYVTMQGPSEFGVKGDATLKNWDVKDKLNTITVPTLSIGAQYDTMDPKQMEWLANEVQNGRYLHCPNGSHLSQYDDKEHFFPGLVSFIKDVDTGAFPKEK